MKKFALAAAVSVMALSAASAQSVRVGMAPEPYPPFTVVDASGNWSGWEIEIMDAVCKAAELSCEIASTAWDGLIPALNAGQIDAIINSMSINEDRLKIIDFSNKYYSTPAMILGTKGVDFTPDAAGLTDKVIGVQVSTIHQAYAEKYFGDVAAEVKAYQTQDEANQDLVAGRLDAVLADSVVSDTFLASAEGQSCCDAKGAVAHDDVIMGVGVGVGLRKGDEALKTAFNTGIAAILADGTYDAITSKYFASSIYGE